jgi:oligoendopeptidase F
MQRGWKGVVVLACAAAGGTVAAPVADEAMHIDLSRHYFASAAVELEDRHALQAMLASLQQQRGRVAASAASLLAALQLDDRIQRSYGRHDAWLLVRCRSDRGDGSFCADDDALGAEVEGKTAFLAAEIAEAAPARLAEFERREPRLRPWRFFIDEARRARAHRMPAPQEEALGEFHAEISGWQVDLYQDAIARADFGTVSTPRGALDVRRQRNLVAVDSDPAVRRQGFEKRLAALASVRDAAAFALVRTAAADNHVARLRGFAGAADAKYFDLGFDPPEVRAMLARVAGQGELRKRFERLRAADVEPALAGAPAGPWDADVPLADIPKMPLEQALSLFHGIFEPMGRWYQDEFDALLAPAHGRVDIVPGSAPRRAAGGFSVGYAGAQSALFVGSFDGTYKDLSVIAHEGGHAVHRDLMNRRGVLARYTEGPHFMFESFADFNELLLADAMAARATDPVDRRYFEERFLAIKGLDFLLGADDAALEQAIHDGVAAGKVASADDLDALTLQVDSRFSIWPRREPALGARWAGMALAIEDPLYSVNYLYASLLALKYFQLWRERPAWFLPRYQALLQDGFDDSPRNLLEKHLGIDLAGPGLLDDAVGVVDGRLRQLERREAAPGAP